MTDRELLERAARAAGMAGEYCDCSDHENGILTPNDIGVVWNPLTDDGDAFRLAVELVIDIRPPRIKNDDGAAKHYTSAEQSYGSDKDRFAATRLAIVRAAAAMAPEEAP